MPKKIKSFNQDESLVVYKANRTVIDIYWKPYHAIGGNNKKNYFCGCISLYPNNEFSLIYMEKTNADIHYFKNFEELNEYLCAFFGIHATLNDDAAEYLSSMAILTKLTRV